MALGIDQGGDPLTLTGPLCALANGGLYYEPRGIRRCPQGRAELEEAPSKGRRVLSPQQAYLMTDMLKAAMDYGTGRPAAIERPTVERRARRTIPLVFWFVGYTPELVASVYVGNDDATPVEGFEGLRRAPFGLISWRPPWLGPWEFPPHRRQWLLELKSIYSQEGWWCPVVKSPRSMPSSRGLSQPSPAPPRQAPAEDPKDVSASEPGPA